MFGIGLPELILIMAIALIVVGPEKLPELAKTLAKQVVELKRAANALKDSLHEEEERPSWEQTMPDRPQLAEFSSPLPAESPGEPGAPGPGPSAGQPAEIGSCPNPTERDDAATG